MDREKWEAEYWHGRPKVDEDGIVIFEVSPVLLKDEAGTIEELQEITGYEVTRYVADEQLVDAPDYPENWTEISIQMKERRGWRCEICGFTARNSPTIQTHHIDHDKSDCCIANLQVLCLKCHAEKHGGGGGMGEYVSSEDRAEMEAWHRSNRRRKY